MFLCLLYALLNLVVFCVGVLLAWMIVKFVLSVVAPTLEVDPRIWQGLGLVVLLVFLIIVVTAFSSGGLCGFGRAWWH